MASMNSPDLLDIAPAIHRALALQARGVAHDLNNVSALLRGAAYLRGEADEGAEADVALREALEHACDRLELIGDELLLADPDGPPGEGSAPLALTLQGATQLMRGLLDADIALLEAPTTLWCALPEGALRAVACKAIAILARGSATDARIEVQARKVADGALVLIRSSALRNGALQLVDPASIALREPGPLDRINPGLWHVEQALRHAGGRLDVAQRGERGEIALFIPVAGEAGRP